MSTRPHRSASHGKHHRPSAAERRAAAALQHLLAAEADQREQMDAAQPENERLLNEQIARWRDGLASRGLSREEPRSPLPVQAVVTSGFGARDIENPLASDNHPGADFVPVYGQAHTPVVAVVSGQVLFSGVWNSKLGNALFIGGDDGHIYVYGHLKKDSQGVYITPGARVVQGEPLAEMGATGNATWRDAKGRLHVSTCLHLTVRQEPTLQSVLDRLLPEVQPTDDPIARITQAVSSGGSLQEQVEAAKRNWKDYPLVSPVISGKAMTRGTIVPAYEPDAAARAAIAKAMEIPAVEPVSVPAPMMLVPLPTPALPADFSAAGPRFSGFTLR